MECPTCKDVYLTISDRRGIYCPECFGVWLDRGELDKIIEPSSVPRRNRKKKRRNQGRTTMNRMVTRKRGKGKNFLDELLNS